jgi:hypothetical protein
VRRRRRRRRRRGGGRRRARGKRRIVTRLQSGHLRGVSLLDAQEGQKLFSLLQSIQFISEGYTASHSAGFRGPCYRCKAAKTQS